MDIAVGTIIAGKYQLDRLIARGGMGSVWAAHHVKLASPLAIKFLDARFAESTAFMDRFEREARSAAALHSPHVVHVQDFGVEDRTPYLVMELLLGEDLGARLHRVRRISLPETARIALQVSKALRKAHEAGIVHRDLKPANLFLTRADDEEIVKILDFGIAKETGTVIGEATRTGELLGSPHYMSPEQARADKDIDHRADLWSLGVILYRCVTGALPFQGDVLGAVLSRILVDPPPPVATLAGDLPPSLDAFFARALAKSKEHRFQSAREMVDAFFVSSGGAPLSSSNPLSFRGSLADVPAPAAAVPGALPPATPSLPTPQEGHTPRPALLLSPLPPAPTLTSSVPGPVIPPRIADEPDIRPPRSPVRWIAAIAGALAGVAIAVGWGLSGSDSAEPGAEPPAVTVAPSAAPPSSAEPSAAPLPSPSAAPQAPSSTPTASASAASSVSAASSASAAPSVSASATATATAKTPRGTGTSKTGGWGF